MLHTLVLAKHKERNMVNKMENKCIIATAESMPLIEEIENSLEKRILTTSAIDHDLECFNKRYILAMKGNITIGYIGVSLLNDHADIISLAIKPEYVRQGYGKMLIDEVIKICKTVRIPKIFLEVRVSNLPAINLYLSMGFEQISIRKKYYEHKEDACIMCKQI